MADRMTHEQRHRCMSSVRSKGTKPEMKVRTALHHRGFRFRTNVKKLPGTPDIVLAKYRTVIFINGCFWHGHVMCREYRMPQSNIKFWEEKILNNQRRDAANNARLEEKQWNVITVWECELRSKIFDNTIEHLVSELNANMFKWEKFTTERKYNRKLYLADKKSEKEKAKLLKEEHITRKNRKKTKNE
jgi:DNA mismatch endonuclease (patch repair protein)